MSLSSRFVAASSVPLLLLGVGVARGDAERAPATQDQTVRAEARRMFDAGPRGTIGPMALRGTFAVVDFDGVIERHRQRGQFLYRHYPFGWQLVGMSQRFRRCDLLAFGVPVRDIPALDAIGTRPPPSSRCPGANMASPNPTADEVSVRSIMSHRMPPFLIGPVVFAGAYAVAGWYIHGGGERVFRKGPKTWHLIGGGGGAISTMDLVRMDIPPRDANLLDRRFRAANIGLMRSSGNAFDSPSLKERSCCSAWPRYPS